MTSVCAAGSVEGIRHTFSEFIQYLGNRDFNTENRGVETLTLILNDKANVEIAAAGVTPPEQVTTREIDFFIKSINDAPTLEFGTPEFTLLEDGELPISNVMIDDVDLNEQKCKDGKCEPAKGLMFMKIFSQNGTFSLLPGQTVSAFSGLIMLDYGTEVRLNNPIYSEPRVYECMWRQWCDDLSGPPGSQKLGLDFDAPCAHLPRYHLLDECVNIKLPFCQLVWGFRWMFAMHVLYHCLL